MRSTPELACSPAREHLNKTLHWNIHTRLRIVDTARGAVAFLLFLLPKLSVEAEQRQQMVPRASRSTVGFQLLDSQETMARIREPRRPILIPIIILLVLLAR
jgi:hypothetical protein